MLRCIFLLLSCVVVFGLKAADQPSNKDCFDCHSDKELTKTNASGKSISLFVDEAVYKVSSHATNLCVGCHSDLKSTHPDDNLPAKPVDCAQCHARQTESFGASVHGLAIKAGKTESATCIDCHGKHNISNPTSNSSPLHWSKLTATCGECHPDAAKDVEVSVHGQAIKKGEREAATCTDCHSEHKIQTLKNGSALRLSGEVCGKCHASEKINTKFQLPANRVKTFFESYHGLAVQSGSPKAANCGSCHGYHKVLPSANPDSTIHPNHLRETCGKCHPGATEKFSQGKIHLDDTVENDLGSVINRWVRRIYLAMIFGVVGALGFHNLLNWLHQVIAAYQHSNRTVQRMDRGQRYQHFILLSSFIILALSGFALKYPNSWLAWLFFADENYRRWVHRIAGVALLGVGFWHIFYLAAKAQGRALVSDLMFRPQDIKDMFINVKYLLTGKGAHAKFGRFGYPEKLEYWAVVWGTMIMGVTGMMIWFKMDVTRWLPRWSVEVATTVHYYEAILACLAIIVWHFYHVMFDPKIYPMNWAWLDGKVDAHWHEEEHPNDTEPRKAQTEKTDAAKKKAS